MPLELENELEMDLNAEQGINAIAADSSNVDAALSESKGTSDVAKSSNSDSTTIVTEGKAQVVFPSKNQVFYNPVQEFNRDMSVAFINVWSELYLNEPRKGKGKQILKPTKNITIFEGLSATGLRSIRYAKEIKNATKIIANDFDKIAVESIERNVLHNNVQNTVEAHHGDCNFVMQKATAEKNLFDVIDLDPYGSASPFIDAAIRAISEGGLLCVTCTDMAVLAGGQSEACYSKYGGLSIHNTPYCHEMGLRMILHLIQSTAARYDKFIEPLASCSIDFYSRVFVRIRSSPIERKKTASKTSMVYHCHGCKSFYTQALGKITENGNSIKFGSNRIPVQSQRCDNCNGTFQVGGPFYSGPLHSTEFLSKLLLYINENKDSFNTYARMLGMLTVMSEELSTPFYYSMPNLSGAVHCNTPKLSVFCSALLNQGFKVSSTHCSADSIKTDASPEIVWDIMRSWVKLNPVSEGKEGDPSRVILVKDPKYEFQILVNECSIVADFTKHPNAEPASRKVRLVRFQENPTQNWGPKARAGKRAIDFSKQQSSKKVKKDAVHNNA